MVEIDIPGFGELRLEHLVFDYNGTLAVDGRLLPGVQERLNELAERLNIHVVTADTFGRVTSGLEDVHCAITILSTDNQAEEKRDVVRKLGSFQVAAIGNGRNDRFMLQESVLGIALIQTEGASAQALRAADIVCTSIGDALSLLRKPLRLVATLRS
jgi:soluble P-type ATPase